MLFEVDQSLPVCRQIYQAIRLKILNGQMPAGGKVPSSRSLAKELGISRNTVTIAYEILTSEGYLISSQGAGTYIAPMPESFFGSQLASKMAPHRTSQPHPRLSDYSKNLGNASAEPPNLETKKNVTAKYDFRHGHPAIDVLSHRIWRHIVQQHAARFTLEQVSYGPPQGHPALRAAIMRYLRDRRGVECEQDEIVIVNGSQQALDLLGRILVNPGDAVVVEEPCYPGTRQALTGLGAKVHSVPVDNEGLITRDLASLPGPVRLICVTPSHQYPTGSVMPLKRRLELIAFARKVGAYIIEDDYDSEFRYGARPEQSVQGLESGDRVVYVGTFSKVLFPALRLGYVVLPKTLVEPFVIAKSVTDRYTATFFQGVVADFIAEGHFERHLRRVRVQMHERRDALVDALHTSFHGKVRISGESAGLHLLAWFPDISRASLEAGIRRASAAGVAVYSVDPCYAVRPRTGGLVMGFASMAPEVIREGIQRLSRSLTAANGK